MSLKSIKSNYIKFLQVLKDAGMTINESQKEVLDNFMGTIEDTISQTRDDAIRTTKRLVEEKMEKDYKVVVESILSHKQKHSSLTEKIQSAVTKTNDTKDLTEAVDMFLDKYVEKILPKKDIVDYARLEKLERINESLRNMLCVSESEDTAEKKDEKEEKNVEDAETTEKNTESEKKDEVKKDEEQQELKESTEETEETSDVETKETADTMETSAETTEETPKAEEEGEEGETNLEEAIKTILGGEKAASTEKENSSKDAEGTETNPETAENDEVIPDEFDEDEPQSVRVDEATMQQWIEAINRTTPQK